VVGLGTSHGSRLGRQRRLLHRHRPPDLLFLDPAYATNTAKSLLLFLVGITIFYTGEAMHRDREVRIEPVVWATPAQNNVLLLSKFLTTILLTFSLLVLVGLSAIVIQFLRGHTPVEIQTYLITYSVILLPGMFFMTGVSVMLNVLLRDKYLAYAVSIGTGGGLFYLYSQGYNHWLYNPLLYQLWNYSDLTGAGNNQATILIHRLYCVAFATLCLSLAHLFFQRKSMKGLRVDGRLSAAGWSSLAAIVSVVVAIIAGLFIILPAR
jgi:ABC-2 type transport system permease protein